MTFYLPGFTGEPRRPRGFLETTKVALHCTRCDGTGFLNVEQIEDESIGYADPEAVLAWIESHDEHDVSVCDCCGNGEEWYGTPGEH